MTVHRGFDAALRMHLVHRPSPLVVVTYSTTDEMEEILEDINFQLSFSDIQTIRLSIDEAIVTPNVVAVVVIPLSEQEETIDRLHAFRDRLGARTAPVVLLLPRGGAAMQRLRLSPYLESWLRGRILDRQILNAIDIFGENQAFLQRVGCSPQAFIDAVGSGETDELYSDNMLLQRAQFLVQSAS